MGIFDYVQKQFVEAIEWPEPRPEVLAFRYPMRGREIQNGALLNVREGQVALFVHEGEAADLFRPGRYTMSYRSLPRLRKLKNWDKLFVSPFKADIYFFSTRPQLNLEWGAIETVIERRSLVDGFGHYDCSIEEPRLFYEMMRGRDVCRRSDLEIMLRPLILDELTAFLSGRSSKEMKDLFEEPSLLQANLSLRFSCLGLRLENFEILDLSQPANLMPKRSSTSSLDLFSEN